MKISSLLSFVVVSLSFAYTVKHPPHGTEKCPAHSQNEDQTALVTLIQDSPCNDRLPKNFRRMQDNIFDSKTYKTLQEMGEHIVLPDLTGLKELALMASGQFSVEELEVLLNGHIDRNMQLVILDLRKESHGFLNHGLPISWYCPMNWILLDKDDDYAKAEEIRRLEYLSSQPETVLFKKKKELLHDPTVIEINHVTSEQNAVESRSVIYHRFPILDHRRPSDDMVERLVSFFETHSFDEFQIYVHCKGGAGRTTTILVMMDSFYNSHKVSLEDIVRRQYLLGKSDLSKFAIGSYKFDFAKERFEFVKMFYVFTKQYRNINGIKSWKLFVKTRSQRRKQPRTDSFYFLYQSVIENI